MTKPKKQTRRTFLKLLGVTGAGLVIGITVTRDRRSPFPANDLALEPDAFLQITPENVVNFFLPHAEMGQGVYTGLTTLIAEELDISPEKIQVHHANAHAAYRHPEFRMQITGGSTSIKVRYQPLRQAAANARALLLDAAAEQLAATRSDLTTANGDVVWNGKHFPYGDFATTAASLKLSDDASLKETAEFRYIGGDVPRLDARAKTTGDAMFGLDVEIPNMHRAVLVRCPVIGGAPKSVNANAARETDGVTDVVTIFNGVAVVATSYWQAKKAADKLEIEWDYPALQRQSSAEIRAAMEAALEHDDGKEIYVEGSGAAALDDANSVVEATYWAPYLAHAPMEPMNCTARIEDGNCDVWVGTQVPELARGLAAFHAGIGKRHVTIHQKFLGGGFGRRGMADYVSEAVAIAKESGKPVQLVWSREDDTKNSYYRPASLTKYRAGLGSEGRIESWSVKRVGPNILPHIVEHMVDGMLPAATPDGIVSWLSDRPHGVFKSLVGDPFSVEGLFEDYDIANKEVRHVTHDPGLRASYWRSVGHSYSGFFKESFVDELAAKSGKDPVEFRLAHLSDDSVLRRAIELAADKGAWATGSAPGVFNGFAAHTSFGAGVAQIAEVSIENRKIRVNKVTCAIDCGVVVNPDIVKANVESAIIYGLTAALYGDITLVDGQVEQGNFHDYTVMRMADSPQIDVHIVSSTRDPVGVGEPGLPPVAAAVANAVFAATGQRLRDLPLKLA
ncbi:MAG: molybdopterin-dependent oxidoreductase [Gammaproteobacteria bacterium]|nr:molybdopterin-dependent oxidoreductase [Gammaproteobacteria bacterium]